MQASRETVLLSEYDEIMAGNKKTFSSELFKGDAANRDAAVVLRYVFRDILRWTPAECQNRITLQLLRQLKLYRVAMKVRFPAELNRKEDAFFLATLIYPDEVRYDKKDYVLRVYKKVLSRESVKFPRGFFQDEEGLRSLKTCLRYAIDAYLPQKSRKALFLFFADGPEATKFLKECHLYSHVAKRYVYPIDLVYETVPPTEEGDMWYHFGRFLLEWNRTYPVMKRKAREQDGAAKPGEGIG